MSTNLVRKVWGSIAFVVSLIMVLGATVSFAAPSPVIRARPLTPQEIKDAGLTNTTQQASGIPNAGLGTPLYLEVLVSNKALRVASSSFTIVSHPAASTATLQASPLRTNTVGGITNVLSYDIGDQGAYVIAGRTMLVPDIASKPVVNGDYVVAASVTFTNNSTVRVTNTFYGSVFIGCMDLPFDLTGAGLCVLCHNAPYAGSKMDYWSQTAHASALTRKINGTEGQFKSTCISCHSLGYDTTATATNGGFDDVALLSGWTFPTNLTTAALAANPNGATNNWNLMPDALKNKSNIQCESCHGPADRHAKNLGDKAAIGISLSAGNCGFCHDSMTHHVKNYEWKQSVHGSGGDTYRPYSYYTNWIYSSSNYAGVMNPRFYNTCGHCHSAEGFILDTDPNWAAETNPLALGTGYEGITCAACHDPHTVGMGDYQLRVFTNLVLMNNYTNTLGGTGLLCMQCHHDRINAPDVDRVSVNSTNTYAPHHSPQGDMLLGKNALQYGMQMPSSGHINLLEDSCVECHMAEGPTNGPALNHIGGHTWNLSYTTNSTTYELTETCVKCHGDIDGFNFGGIDYDHDGVVEGVQAEVQGLLDTLAKLLPYSNTTTHVISYGTTNKPSSKGWWSLAEKKGAYNYLFVWEDRSMGVHNPKYATAILQASIDDLRGGIDVDRDGLLDSWEIANFGSITNQDGLGDPDLDGLVNRLEMAAGTNPNNADSDGDGISDLVEIQCGSNPLDPLSKPTTNAVAKLPAIELAYLPGKMGVTQHFESVDILSGSWTNVGPSFISSNTWFYQLQSLRNATQKFFRVVTE